MGHRILVIILASGGQLLGRPAPSPGAAGTPNCENVSTPPMPYANSPRSGINMMNTPSPQQHLTPQQQRQKLMQASQQQQLHAQQQLRPSAAGMLAQNSIPQLQDLQGQAQQKLQEMQMRILLKAERNPCDLTNMSPAPP